MFCSTALSFNAVHYVSKNSTRPQRPRTKKDYALMVKIVKREYDLTPGAKLLYEHLADCDFADPISKLCKGYVFHKTERLAQACHIGESSVYRYLAQMRERGLVRTKRRGDVTYIYLLDLPEEKLSTYDNEAKFSKTQNLYNRNLLTNRRIIANVRNVDFTFSAREYTCYERLVSFGYQPTQAIRDITNPEIGVEEIEKQLDNLHQHLNAGRGVKTSCAQWLNYHIRTKYRPSIQLQTPTQTATQAKPKKQYIEIINEQAQTVHLVEVEEAPQGTPAACPPVDIVPSQKPTTRIEEEPAGAIEQPNFSYRADVYVKQNLLQPMIRLFVKGRRRSYPSTNPVNNPSKMRDTRGITITTYPTAPPRPASLVVPSRLLTTPTPLRYHTSCCVTVVKRTKRGVVAVECL